MEKLADEVLLKVFSYLNSKELALSVAPVCSRFRDLAHDKTLWTNLFLDDLKFFRKPPIRAFHRVLRKHSHITHLGIDCEYRRTLNLFRFKSRRHRILLPSVKTFILRSLRTITPNMIKCIVSTCPQIQEFTLIPRNERYNLNPNVFTSLLELKDLHSLTVFALVLTSCTIDYLFNLMTTHAVQLQKIHLDLYGQNTLTDATLHLLCLTHQKTLTHLYLFSENLTNNSIHSLKMCQQLTSLKIFCCDNIGDPAMTTLGELTQLQTIVLHNVSVTSKALETLFQQLRSLTYIELERMDVTFTVLQQMAKNCIHLKTLKLFNCGLITDDILYPVITHCRKLEYLCLVKHEVTVELIDQIPKNMTHLKGIFFSPNKEKLFRLKENMPQLEFKVESRCWFDEPKCIRKTNLELHSVKGIEEE